MLMGPMKEGELFDIQSEVELTPVGAQRLRKGHLWIYAGDVAAAPLVPAPIVRVRDASHNVLGFSFYSPQSQIRLRLLSRETQPPSADLIRERLRLSIERRRERLGNGLACRLVFGEADLLPSVVVDCYGEYLVLQTLSSGADALKYLIVDQLRELRNPAGVLERNDVKARRLEGLDERCGILWGNVPDQVRISEGGVQFWVDLLGGQKTGFFLDQSDNRIAAGNYAFGRCLDCFTNTGAFALHFAPHCASVIGVDASAPALAQARRNAELNGSENVGFQEGNVFDFLRERERAGEKFDTICLDPPAFAKNRGSLPAARGGYKEINLRALKLLAPEGILITSSCSYHLSEGDFFELLHQAAQDAHRHLQVLERRAQSTDHPVLLGMPETHYLKCFILRAL
jgi:23S rRNA (cytosine1962-C5)-methyltransferase